MIRFSAFLVAAATVLLVAGVVTSKLALVYVAIGVSGVALLALLAGAALKRDELFGKEQGAVSGEVPAAAAAPSSAPGAPVASAVGSVGAVGASAGARAAFPGDPFPSAAAWSAAPDIDATRTSARPSAPAERPSAPERQLPPEQPSAAWRRPSADADWFTRTTGRPAAEAGTEAAAETGPAAEAEEADGDGADEVAGSAPTERLTADLDEETTSATGVDEPESADDTTAPDTPAEPETPEAGTTPSDAATAETVTQPADQTPPASEAPGEAEPPAEQAGEGTSGDVGSPEEPEPDTAAAAATPEVTVVPGVPRYHTAECILIRFMGEDDLERMTLAEASDAGCTPCRACLPDQPAA